MAGRVAYTGGIVRNGLVLNLDAAKRDSYPKTGTVWTDLSGNRYNGTLTNGPTYSSVNGGSIVFDGSNDYVSLTTLPSLSSFTVEFWFNCLGSGSTGATDYSVLIGSNNSNRLLYRNTTNVLLAQMGAGNHFSTATIPLNTWGCVHYVYNSSNTTAQWFVNSSADTTLVGAISLNTSQRIGTTDLANYMMRGNIAITKIYNKALSASEVLQNYNALKGRFS